MQQPHFKYDIEELDIAKKYLDTQVVYDPNRHKNVNALWFMEQKKLPKTIEWHSMIQMANKLKEGEIASTDNTTNPQL